MSVKFWGKILRFLINPYDLIQMNILNNEFGGMLTWIYEFRPGNKTIYAVLDEESEFSGPRT